MQRSAATGTIRLIAVLVVVGLLVGACDGTSDSSDTTTSAPTTSPTTTTTTSAPTTTTTLPATLCESDSSGMTLDLDGTSPDERVVLGSRPDGLMEIAVCEGTTVLASATFDDPAASILGVVDVDDSAPFEILIATVTDVGPPGAFRASVSVTADAAASADEPGALGLLALGIVFGMLRRARRSGPG